MRSLPNQEQERERERRVGLTEKREKKERKKMLCWRVGWYVLEDVLEGNCGQDSLVDVLWLWIC